jgi:prepilin-type processing-associated H-X9-DG protein
MAIIAILAALLLPAIQKAIFKGRQTWCASNLRQVGIAFQTFSHDYGGRFPQAVPVSQGGVLEYALSGQPRLGDLWLKPEVFRVMSNELGNLRVALCPAVVRQVTGFPQLRAADTTYFLGLGSSPDLPLSLVSGDNNLSPHPVVPTNAAARPAGAQAGVTSSGRLEYGWTRERHDQRGNLLFADGHVEGHRSLTLPTGTAPAPRPVPTAGFRSAGFATGNESADPGRVGAPMAPKTSVASSSIGTTARPARAAQGTDFTPAYGAPVTVTGTGPTAAGDTNSLATSPRRTRRALHEEVVETTFWWLYLIALLLGILAIAWHVWQRRRVASESTAS